MTALLRKCLHIVLVFKLYNVVYGEDPTVILNGVKIIGKNGVADFQGSEKTFRAFKGIPYAEPPVGELRFKKPHPLEKLPTATFDASEYGAGCLQPPLPVPLDIMSPKKQSEDCLFVNVFVPDQEPDQPSGHAVMVYIHGGGYVIGCGELGGEYPATYGNVILVSINYRLGAFGFLGVPGDEEFPGNLGLWDQRLALQWVHGNIAAFGGDNKRVTIFGESAGSASVLHQALYPKNEGLFQRVVAESGTPAMKFLFLYTHLDSLKTYSELVGCNNDTPKEQIKCLKDMPADRIAAAVEKVNEEKSLLGTQTFPYLDNDFITVDSLKLANLNNEQENAAIKFYRSLDVINGVNSHEGLGLFDPTYVPVIDNPETFKPTRKLMDEAIPSVVDMHYGTLSDTLLTLVRDFYTDWSDPNNPDLLRDQLIKLMGDLMMVIPLVQFSRLHVNTTGTINSFVYRFSPTPSNPIIPVYEWARGANHVEELNFVFSFHCFDERYPSNDWEYELSYDIMKYWTNFAKTGDPNKPEAVKVQWRKYDMSEQSFLEFNGDMKNEYSKKHFSAREADFWLKTIPMLKEALDPTSRNVNEGTCSKDGDCP